MRPMTTPLLALFLTLACAPLAATERPPRSGDDGVNIRVTLTVVESDGEAQSIRALLLEDQRTRLNSGWRVPTAVALEVEGGEQRASAIQYQDVGLETTLRGRVVAQQRIRIDGELELSALVASDSERPLGSSAPKVSTFRQIFDVILEEGTGTTVAEVPGPDGGSVTLTITATIAQ